MFDTTACSVFYQRQKLVPPLQESRADENLQTYAVRANYYLLAPSLRY